MLQSVAILSLVFLFYLFILHFAYFIRRFILTASYTTNCIILELTHFGEAQKLKTFDFPFIPFFTFPNVLLRGISRPSQVKYEREIGMRLLKKITLREENFAKEKIAELKMVNYWSKKS